MLMVLSYTILFNLKNTCLLGIETDERVKLVVISISVYLHVVNLYFILPNKDRDEKKIKKKNVKMPTMVGISTFMSRINN